MSNALNEAILEAKKLREVAEANAKKALIEAVTPKVRELIEKELLGESLDESDEDIIESAVSALGEADDGCDVGCDPEEKKQGKKDDEKQVITDNEHCMDENEDPLVLSKESAEFLNALLEDPKKHSLTLESRLAKAKKRVGLIREFLSTSARKDPKAKVMLTSMLTNLVRETRSLENDVIRIAEKEQKGRKASLTSELKRIRKEIVEMTGRSKRKLKEGSVADEMYEIDLKELDEPEMPPMDGAPEDELPPVGDELPADDGALDDEIGGGSVEIPMDLAQELLAALEGEVGEDDDMGGEELPPMIPDEGDDAEGDEGEEGEEEDEEISDDDVVEIDESVLRRELARMKNERRLREGKGSSHSVHDASVLDDFGGGSVDREVFVDSDDSDLNVLEVKRLRKQLQSESRKNRALRRSVESFKQATTKLKEQLEQLNLFNAKLLYVNKLMTNEGVTPRQKKAIIESLEKARTLREVKLLYKTLSASLQKGRKDTTPMNESTVRKTASASRPVKGGGTTSSAAEDTQMDRWSILAGIPKDAK